MSSKNDNEVGLIAVFTLVLWVFCAIVSVVGLLTQSHGPPPPAPPPPHAQLLTVQLADELPPSLSAPPVQPKSAPAAPQTVAEPSTEIPFELPIAGPVRIASTREAVPVSAPVHLTFGVGEGRQPSPEYPREAVLAQEQGTVVVVFTVGTNGRVTSAIASSPSPWEILNQAAVRRIRQAWRFSPGPVRTYQVAIQFQLTNGK